MRSAALIPLKMFGHGRVLFEIQAWMGMVARGQIILLIYVQNLDFHLGLMIKAHPLENEKLP